jgi:prevent-host-death family protein
MKTVTFTEFRSRASGFITAVEKGETIVVTRHGRAVAEVSPPSEERDHLPSWKRPRLKLTSMGAGLSKAILQERQDADVL